MSVKKDRTATLEKSESVAVDNRILHYIFGYQRRCSIGL
jgi:hypothetical protein